MFHVEQSKNNILMNKIDAKIVDVLRKEIFPARICYDTHIHSIERLLKAPDVYIIPGLVDAHIHIESSMMPPSEFARIAVRHGTLAVVTDPHEITNVLGLSGIDFMINDATTVPFRFIFGAPSCVPATTFETAGATLTVNDIDKLFFDGKASYLSEMMNFPGVVHEDSEVMTKIAVAQKYRKPIDGHAPRLTGEALRRYVYAGITTDHECTSLVEAEEKIHLGMKIIIREGSAAKNFDALHHLIDKYPAQVMLCSDDLHPNDLVRGHLDLILAKGVAKGLDVFSLLRTVTINPVEHYQIDLGLVHVGDSADFIILENLTNFKVLQSFSRGVCLFNRVGEECINKSTSRQTSKIYPNLFNAKAITAFDIEVEAISEKMKVIQVFDGELFTKKIFHKVQKELPVGSDISADILKLVVVNRYQPTKPSVAFVRGFDLKHGALVSSVAHDSHHIIAVGCDDVSIIQAINHVINIKGGLAASNGNNILCLKLDIAGLMSSARGEEVARIYNKLNEMAFKMGCRLSSPFMTLSFMALLVIPELKLGEKGLFDVERFEWTELFDHF